MSSGSSERGCFFKTNHHYRSNFSDFSSRYGKDERFRVVEKMREREQMFSEYLSELKKAGGKSRDEQKPASRGKTEKVRSLTVGRPVFLIVGVSAGEGGFLGHVKGGESLPF